MVFHEILRRVLKDIPTKYCHVSPGLPQTPAEDQFPSPRVFSRLELSTFAAHFGSNIYKICYHTQRLEILTQWPAHKFSIVFVITRVTFWTRKILFTS